MELQRAYEGGPLCVKDIKTIYLDHDNLYTELLERFKAVLKEASDAVDDQNCCLFSHDYKDELWEFKTLLAMAVKVAPDADS
jgi:hypothetical protein